MKKILLGLLVALSSQVSLYADDIYEPNNSIAEARTITKGTHSLSGLDEDWFSIELPTGMTTFTMTPSSTPDINMILYNSENQVIGSNFATGQEIINQNIAYSGTYYIKIDPIDPTTVETSGYTLDITTEANGNWETVLNFGPIRDASVTLYDIDNDGKDEIFVGTSKTLNANLEEIRPAGLICLEDDGTVKWTRSFPGMYDIQTGKTYNTTSVTTAPFFSDINGDANIEIIVGVGGDTVGDVAGVMGQPGDKGGVYALDSNGNILWYHEGRETLNDKGKPADGRPNGVYGTPIVYDIDRDGRRDVIINGWDQHVSILDAQSGAEKLIIKMHDSIWSTPKVADINNDGIVEILIAADITGNPVFNVETGGIFHVLSPDGSQNTAGFNAPVGDGRIPELKGKYEPQPLWSSPQTADIDGDGFLEIAYGTSNYFPAEEMKGHYLRVWNHDGSEKFVLPTVGVTFATPLLADINGNGSIDIVAGTLDGYLHAWDGNGNSLFVSHLSNNPIFNAPIAVDINNDGKLEIAYVDGAEITIVDSSGNRVNEKLSMVVYFSKAAPAIKDIDNDGTLDLIAGGTTNTVDQAVVYKWSLKGSSSDGRVGRYQYIGSNTDIRKFIKRMYRETLSREAEPKGLNYWADELVTGIAAGSDIANGFIFSEEFTSLNLDNSEYVTVLYHAFFGREPDETGFNQWVGLLNNGTSRHDVLNGFLYSQEFGILCQSYGIIPVK